MSVVAKAHLIYGYSVDSGRMEKLWENLPEDEYNRLIEDEHDIEAIYGYNGLEYIGYEIQHADEDEDAIVLTDRDIVSQELKDNIKEFAARAFGEPDIADPQYLLVCLCH